MLSPLPFGTGSVRHPPGELWLGDDAAIVSPPRTRGSGAHEHRCHRSRASTSTWFGHSFRRGLEGPHGGRQRPGRHGWAPLDFALVSVSGPSRARLPPSLRRTGRGGVDLGLSHRGRRRHVADQLAVTVAVTGSSPGPPEPAPVRRSGARSATPCLSPDRVAHQRPGSGLARRRGGQDDGRRLAGASAARGAPERRLARSTEWSHGHDGYLRRSLDRPVIACCSASGLGAALDHVPVASWCDRKRRAGRGRGLRAPAGHASTLRRCWPPSRQRGSAHRFALDTAPTRRGSSRLRARCCPQAGWQHTF